MHTIPLKKYTCLFFDLDRTLWDYRSNSEQTLNDLLNRYAPQLIPQFSYFLHAFYKINEKLWLEYRNGALSKDVLRIKRFIDLFAQFKIDASSFAEKFDKDYSKEGPHKSKLFPYAIETLEYLKDKGYRLYLLTNGFQEVQEIKIRESKLEPLFDEMITSEEAGFQKPHKEIFEFALNRVKAEKKECLMIGDDLDTDILGAQRFGMDTVFFNPADIPHEGRPTFEIDSLNGLKSFL